jgi:hypothetical protein
MSENMAISRTIRRGARIITKEDIETVPFHYLDIVSYCDFYRKNLGFCRMVGGNQADEKLSKLSDLPLPCVR